CARDPGYFDVW
nr:immunoglobulin heavy chain junction region [Mus musculus]